MLSKVRSLLVDCDASGPTPTTSLPNLIGTWVNTNQAWLVHPDLCGASSPIRIKSIYVRDGKPLFPTREYAVHR
jgi:hypothetical protein